MDAGSLQGLVAAAASVHSHRVAVTFDGSLSSDGPVSLLYKELLELSGELTHILRKNCSGVIGLYCSDDLFIPVWILGILQTPAAYVPLDLDAPGLLSATVMTKCGLKHCAVKTDLLQRFQAALGKHMAVKVCSVLPKFKLALVRVTPPLVPEHQQRAEPTGAPRADATDLCTSGHLAYVLHTSGTTGHPKTVRVPHRCILPNILHLRSLFQVSADDVVFLASPLTFDPSVVDIFLALSSGATLLIIPAVIKKIPNRLSQLLFKSHKTTILQVTPTLLARFGPRVLKQEVLSSSSSLRVLALGGESCPSPCQLSSWRHEDNTTDIYNIYGVTEVSCWASCYKIPLSHPVSSVPLGTPLRDTVVEVRDELGCLVTEGEGQVFIGGEGRVCLLEHEDTLVPGTMRATGDWVNVKNAQLFYLGRKDRTIKRHGKRVNLDGLQQLILRLPEVDACAVCLQEGWRLLAFVVASGCQEADLPSAQLHVEQPAPASAEHQQHSLLSSVPAQQETASGELSRLILEQLSLLLPPYSVPDTLVLVPALPLTSHGKVDVQALMRVHLSQRQGSAASRGDVTQLKQSLQTFWQGALGLAENAAIDEESNFLFSGGDSLKALRLCEDILTATGVSSPQLLEVILDGTFLDVLCHITKVTVPLESCPLPQSEAKKRQAEALTGTLAKRECQEPTAAARPQGPAGKVLRRAGEVRDISHAETNSFQADVLRGKHRSGDADVESRVLGLSVSWSSDTGRCVDASPVLLVQEEPGEAKTTVFIGSHSHRMQALDLDTGSLLWERVLGGRIEASAAVSRCGRLVVIGCYDGCLYFLCAASGETQWTFETSDAVKSCAAVDVHSGLVMVGSHDGHVYALNPEARRCVWKRHCGGGAVFSSPYIHTSLRQLYVATLGGHLLCLHPDSGDVLWSHRRDVPFFSSPNCLSGRVVIGSVDGNICCFSDVGKPLWQFLTNGPVFSSPCATPDQRRVLCGSHDGCLYCLNCADGSLVWSFQTSAKVYSSPCAFDGSTVGSKGILVALASTDGTVYILDAQNGQTLASCTLPGELFSSPVVYESSIVVGCRNDNVYCLKLIVEEGACVFK
ncbi:beta-alanine-activating enzyme [Aulostomus maculatus]